MIVLTEGLGRFRQTAAASIELDDFRWLNTIVGSVEQALHGTYLQVSSQPRQH